MRRRERKRRRERERIRGERGEAIGGFAIGDGGRERGEEDGSDGGTRRSSEDGDGRRSEIIKVAYEERKPKKR